MNDVIRSGAWWLLAVGVAWQALVGTTQLARSVSQSWPIAIGQRLCDSTEERLARVLGEDAAVARALRDAAMPGEWVLARVALTPAALDERTGSFARLTRLRHALFPAPLLVAAGPEPVAAAEAALPAGQSVLLLVVDDEGTPEGRSGWRCVQRQPGFQVWRLQRP